MPPKTLPAANPPDVSEAVADSRFEMATTDDMIMAFGQCLRSASASFESMHAQVSWLRAQQFRIRSNDELWRVRNIFQKAHPEASSDSLMCYARIFRSLLSCHELPLTFNLTNSIQVPSYEVGDEIDAQFVMDHGKSEARTEWIAGLVIGTRPQKNQALPYEVFWIGSPPRRSGPNRNPMWVSPHILRMHALDAISGTDEEWKSHQKIRDWRMEQIPKVRADDDETDDAAKGEDSDAAAARKRPSCQTSSVASKKVNADDADTVDAAKGEDSGAAAATKRPSRQTPSVPSKKVTFTDTAATSKASHAGSEKRRRPSPKKVDQTQRSNPAHQEKKDSKGVSEVKSQLSSLAVKRTFEMGDSVTFAIECLLSLDRGDQEHPDSFKELKERLTDMARTLAIMYDNMRYNDLVKDTLRELKTYKGQQKPRLPHSKDFLDLLTKHGFCVSPRMFTKCELLCLAIAMLDARHHFVRINGKTADEKKAHRGFRGMALIDSRVQTILNNRLERYGFKNCRFHPKSLQPFSAVVINGGGSWLQSSNWEFHKQFRFAIDKEFKKPFAVVVSDTPGVLEANGLYVATTMRRNGEPVYVQVSAIEFAGNPSTPVKDFIPFQRCLKPEARKFLKPFALDSQGFRLEVCSPRVLSCISKDRWGIQLLPGFDTQMFLVKFSWNVQETTHEANAECFKRALSVSTKDGNMQPCKISISKKWEAISCLKNFVAVHNFSFGTKKFAVRTVDEDCAIVPGPLQPQAIHSDGPCVYNTEVYDEFGDLKATGLSCAEEKKRHAGKTKASKRKGMGSEKIVSESDHQFASPWCPFLPNLLQRFLQDQNDVLSGSWSALGGVFSGTYIETLADNGEVDPLDPLSTLRVEIPLGCMGIFDFLWKHRGKGDQCRKKAEIHARPHDYVYSGDPRKFPTMDIEATLEFTGFCSDTAAHDDPGTKLQVLECLQTFTPETAEGHDENVPLYHTYFSTQAKLNAYVEKAHTLQCAIKRQVELVSDDIDLTSWKISLVCAPGREALQKQVMLVGMSQHGGFSHSITVTVTKADFESDTPLFGGSDGQRYKLSGEAGQPWPCTESHEDFFKDSAFISLVKSATDALTTNWCFERLHYLLSLLDTRVLYKARLSINSDNNLMATTPDGLGIDLLPSYTLLCVSYDIPDHPCKRMRLYTSKGLSTRIAIPDHYPVLRNWTFVPLPSRDSYSGYGFKASGTLSYHPHKNTDSFGSSWMSSEVCGIESEGVVTTTNGSPYRLDGDPQVLETQTEILAIMRRFKQPWFGSETSIQQTMQELSKVFWPEDEDKKEEMVVVEEEEEEKESEEEEEEEDEEEEDEEEDEDEEDEDEEDEDEEDKDEEEDEDEEDEDKEDEEDEEEGCGKIRGEV